MKLIVGLGNPGKEYENTRHNIGFMTINKYLEKNNICNGKEKYNGIYYELLKEKEKIILLKPQKYMNLSGEVVSQYLKYFKIDINDLLVISDDLDMPTGKIKLKFTGSCGGHNGLRDIEKNIDTKEYKRLKIGIANDKEKDTKDYVLGKINNKEEKEQLEQAIELATNIIEDYLKYSFENLMNKYNK